MKRAILCCLLVAATADNSGQQPLEPLTKFRAPCVQGMGGVQCGFELCCARADAQKNSGWCVQCFGELSWMVMLVGLCIERGLACCVSALARLVVLAFWRKFVGCSDGAPSIEIITDRPLCVQFLSFPFLPVQPMTPCKAGGRSVFGRAPV